MSPQDMQFTDRDMALDDAATDTNEQLVKTIVKYKYTQDEFNPRYIAADICKYRITKRETKGLFSRLRQTVAENEIENLAKKEGFDISFFHREETDFYDEESDYEDCSTIPDAPDTQTMNDHSASRSRSYMNKRTLPAFLKRKRRFEDMVPPHGDLQITPLVHGLESSRVSHPDKGVELPRYQHRKAPSKPKTSPTKIISSPTSDPRSPITLKSNHPNPSKNNTNPSNKHRSLLANHLLRPSTHLRLYLNHRKWTTIYVPDVWTMSCGRRMMGSSRRSSDTE